MFKLSVDGSYNTVANEAKGGFVLLVNGGQPVGFHVDIKDMLSAHRNITGELISTMLGLSMLLDVMESKNILNSSIELTYDYEGIEYLPKGKYKPRTDLAKTYVYVYNYYILPRLQKRNIVVQFRKIKSHTGDYLNELADKAAKGELPNLKHLDGPQELATLLTTIQEKDGLVPKKGGS